MDEEEDVDEVEVEDEDEDEDEDEEGTESEGDNVGEMKAVPGSLETVAGDEREPSSSRTKLTKFT